VKTITTTTTAVGAQGEEELLADEGNGTDDEDDDFNYDDDDFENYDDDFEDEDDDGEEDEDEDEDEEGSLEDEEVVVRGGGREIEKKLDSGNYELQPAAAVRRTSVALASATARHTRAEVTSDRQLAEVKKAMAEENRLRVRSSSTIQKKE
jgi:hypothetical protein